MITEDTLLAALISARDGGKGARAEGAVTTQELCKRLGWSARRVRTALRDLAGQIEVVRVPVRRLDGYITTVSGYRYIGGGTVGRVVGDGVEAALQRVGPGVPEGEDQGERTTD